MKNIFIFVFSSYFTLAIGFISNIIFVRLYGISIYGSYLYNLLLLQLLDAFFNELARSKIKKDSVKSETLYSNILFISLFFYFTIYIVYIDNIKIFATSLLLSFNTFFSKFLDNSKFHSTVVYLNSIQTILLFFCIMILYFLKLNDFDYYLNFSILILIFILSAKIKKLNIKDFKLNLYDIFDQIIFIKHRLIDILSGTLRDKAFNIIFVNYLGANAYAAYTIIFNYFNILKKLLPSIFYKYESKILENSHYIVNKFLIENFRIYVFIFAMFSIMLLSNLDLIFRIYNIDPHTDYYQIAYITALTSLTSFSTIIYSLLYDFNNNRTEIIKIAIIRLMVFILLLIPYFLVGKYIYLLHINLISVMLALVYYTITSKNIAITKHTLLMLALIIFVYYTLLQ